MRCARSGKLEKPASYWITSAPGIFQENPVVVLSHTMQSAEMIGALWIKRRHADNRTPRLTVLGVRRFATVLRGMVDPVAVYFDEYMLLEEDERKMLYDIRHRYNFAGGTATYR